MRAIAQETGAYEYIIGLIYERCRIKLHDGKEALIKARLGKRMRHHGMESLAEYCDFLRTRAEEDEFTLVVDALTTNFTNFLREEDHFQFMVQQALPAVLPKGQRRFHVWSAACSSGEEPFTIAMYLADTFPLAQGWDWRITGSDISTKVLAAAQRGVYAEERVRTIPPEWLRKYFQKGLGKWAGHYRVKAALGERVTFRQVNLIETYEHRQAFELIFCRNVMIYFDRPTQEQLVNRLCRFLVPQGHLLIGHSESLTGLSVPLRCVRPSIYQRA
ncbi:MAG: protein-glutamate O-methyltransferase CheR [Verrucomicrobiota bacterium]